MNANAAPFAGTAVYSEAEGMEQSRITRWIMYALVAYPLVDYALRLPHIHPIGVIWDKVVLLVLALIAMKRWIAGVRPTVFAWQRFAAWYILFALALMFAGLNHPLVAIDGFRTDIYYMLYAFLLPFVVAPKDVPKLLHAAAAIAILIGIHGVYQYITKAPILPGWVDVGEHVRTRVYSVLISPNELGAYMALMTPVVFGLFIYEQRRWTKWMYGIGSLFCLMTLLFTFTRGAWAGLALAVFLVAVIFERRLLILLVAVVVIAFFIPAIQHRFTDLLSPVYYLKSATQGGRIARWLDAFDHMAPNPLFGAGLGQYGGLVATDFHLGIYSDGFYAKTLGESGIVGLVLFLAMHIALIREVIRKVVRPMQGRAKFVALGGVTGLLAVLFHNSVENVFEFAPMMIMYFNLATLYLIWGNKAATSELE
ncbi:O-antigen ligase family protein [Alicyclobacillus tolerans]|uniref:O-antigen ligase family protein n=1 Tax=Alicyclobacillus tolerans TaxID=90970 RepID=UPI001F41118C|nr:O-antigen ligase family protein [Alicyclobacillus tolerans]MCF8565012.1 O-antigen ligase family protein [Alicyclobacillus tolerans]